MARKQEKFLTAATPAQTFLGGPGNVSISGTFDGGTVTQSLIDDSVSVDTFTAETTFFMDAEGMVFGITGGGGSENISVKWYPVRRPT